MKDGTYREPKDYPEEWARFIEYAMRDIDALRSVYRRLPSQATLLAQISSTSSSTPKSIAADSPWTFRLLRATVDLLDRAKQRGDASVSLATDGAVTAITQRDKLLAYLERKGLKLPNLRKAELENALQNDDLSPGTAPAYRSAP